jgi:hypothetical protein
VNAGGACALPVVVEPDQLRGPRTIGLDVVDEGVDVRFDEARRAIADFDRCCRQLDVVGIEMPG